MRVLRRDQRRHLLSIYDFARRTDQIGDEADGDRLAQLDALESELERAVDGAAASPIIAALVSTIRECELPLKPFRRLIAANRLDQKKHRYATWSELLDYCALSANPIGELVLRVFGIAVPQRRHWSDAVCSGLQIVEHIQDVGEDHAAGRIYLPAEDLDRFGCQEWQLGERFACAPVRDLLRFEAQRARDLLDLGVPLIRSMRGRAQIAVSGFVAGGRAALDAIASTDFDTLATRSRPRRRDLARQLLRIHFTIRAIGQSA